MYISSSHTTTNDDCNDKHDSIVSYRLNYRQVSNISSTLAGNKTVDHSDVVGALPVGAAPTTFSFILDL